MPFLTSYAVFTSNDLVDNATRAAEKLRQEFGDFTAGVIVYFAGSNYDYATLAAAMDSLFPEAVTFGCSSSGESVDELVLSGSVTAMALSGDEFDFTAAALILGDDNGSVPGVPDAFRSPNDALKHMAGLLDLSPLHLDYKKLVGFALFDEITAFSERAIDSIGELTNVNFVGGFAGDDYKFVQQSVFYRGKVFRNAGVIALWQPKNGYALLKTQAFIPSTKTMVVTKIDEGNRIVWEFDNRPAIDVYAEHVGIPKEKIDILVFDDNPLAIMVGTDPFLRAAVHVVDNRGIQFFASLQNNIRMMVGKTGNILSSTESVLSIVRADINPIRGAIHVNCASRHTSLEKRNQVEEFGKLFHGIPNVGFSSYGEIYVGIIAMTSTFIVFK